MSEYHKIQTVFKRDPETNFKTLLLGEYSLPEFEYLADNRWVYTEKVDGTNIRIYFRNGEFSFGGRTDRAQIPADLVNALNALFLPQQAAFVAKFGNNTEVCFYGEGYGPKIQKGGGNYRSDQSFVLFDVNIGGWWLQRVDVEDIAQSLGLDIVPILGVGSLAPMIALAQEGFKSRWGDFQAEGIVARPKTELCTRSGHRIITKIKCKDFPAKELT